MLTVPHIRSEITLDGVVPHPSTDALYAPLVLYGLERHRLTHSQRMAFAGAAATVIAIDLLRNPQRSSTTDLAFASQLCLTAYFAARSWGRLLDDQAAEVAANVAAEVDATGDAGFDEGRRYVIDLVRDGLSAANAKYADVAGQLDPKIAAVARERLTQMQDRMDQLMAPVETSRRIPAQTVTRDATIKA